MSTLYNTGRINSKLGLLVKAFSSRWKHPAESEVPTHIWGPHPERRPPSLLAFESKTSPYQERRTSPAGQRPAQ